MQRFVLAMTLVLGFLPAAFTAEARDDWGNRYDVVLAAHELDQATSHFHHVVERYDGYSHLAADVHQLNQAASHFHDVVEGGAAYRHVLRDYQRVETNFHHVSSAFYRAHNTHHDRHIQSDWQRVEDAAYDLERVMYDGGHGPH